MEPCPTSPLKANSLAFPWFDTYGTAKKGTNKAYEHRKWKYIGSVLMIPLVYQDEWGIWEQFQSPGLQRPAIWNTGVTKNAGVEDTTVVTETNMERDMKIDHTIDITLCIFLPLSSFIQLLNTGGGGFERSISDLLYVVIYTL